jgi:arylformamidase
VGMTKTMKIYDITPVISSRMAVFPGDVPYSREVTLDFSSGNNLLLSSMRTTMHLGAHADASNHYNEQGEGIDKRDLSYYLGPVQVVRVTTKRGDRIKLEDLGDEQVNAQRILFCTGSYPDPDSWNSDFTSLSPDLVDFLASHGVILVGIDTPSIDPSEDKALLSHARVAHHKMAILEGVVLETVPQGIYDLIALPLKIENADASPVRAVLLPSGSLTLGI